VCLLRDDGCCVVFPGNGSDCARFFRGCVFCELSRLCVHVWRVGCLLFVVCWFLLLTSTVGVSLVGAASKRPTGLQGAVLAIVLHVCSRGCGKGAFCGGLSVVCSACRLGQCFARAFLQSTATPFACVLVFVAKDYRQAWMLVLEEQQAPEQVRASTNARV
jgi:hypothetical protein